MYAAGDRFQLERRLKSFKDFIVERKTEKLLQQIAAGTGRDAERARAELAATQARRSQFHALLSRQADPQDYLKQSVAVKRADDREQRDFRKRERRARAAGRIDPEEYRYLNKYGPQP